MLQAGPEQQSGWDGLNGTTATCSWHCAANRRTGWECGDKIAVRDPDNCTGFTGPVQQQTEGRGT